MSRRIHRKSPSVWLVLAFFASLLPGCVVAADNGPGPAPVVVETGSLVIDWTIDGDQNPDQCDQSDASMVDVTVFTTDGASAGEFRESCRAFATTIDLPPGAYTADAVLIDASGGDRTTPAHVSAFRIDSNDQFSAPVDFSASSFY